MFIIHTVVSDICAPAPLLRACRAMYINLNTRVVAEAPEALRRFITWISAQTSADSYHTHVFRDCPRLLSDILIRFWFDHFIYTIFCALAPLCWRNLCTEMSQVNCVYYLHIYVYIYFGGAQQVYLSRWRVAVFGAANFVNMSRGLFAYSGRNIYRAPWVLRNSRRCRLVTFLLKISTEIPRII